ncbi:HAD family hydrolase [Ruminococcus bromii]|uniref:HAD family hydrolase n=1 Tax=Ruminococcus bromii TaxID=40518 RepID=UPI003A944950
MKKLVIFGFDGTLADTAPGILYCFNTTAVAMGYEPVEHSALYGVIGVPLEYGFKTLFNMSDDEIEYAVKNYSKLYSQKGKEMFTVYDGIYDALRDLKKNGFKLAIATQKHRMFTTDMLENYDAADVFDAVCATDVGTNLTKSHLLLQACEQTGVSVEESVLVGDGTIEANGAEEIGMDFLAVLYGWGFRTKEETEKYKCSGIVAAPAEIVPRVLAL